MISIKKIIHLAETDSTNNYLKDRFEKNLLVYTDRQVSGRGQRNNSWESEAGKNILMSVGIVPDFLKADTQFFLSIATSLAVYDFLCEFTEHITIKWPNDIYVKDKKIAGILIENSIKGVNISKSIIGIGININQKKFPEELVNPVSLSQINGQKYKIDLLLQKIIKKLNNRYKQLAQNKYTELKKDYLTHLYAYGEKRNYLIDKKELKGVIKGVENNGKLIVEFKNGLIRRFAFKEISFIID